MTETLTKVVKIVHPFERAGLGKAPFRCINVIEKAYTPFPGAPSKAAGSCDYCGTGIRWAYVIKGSDESPNFLVGCDCVAKTDRDLYREVKVVRREYARRQVEQVRRTARQERKAQVRATRRETLAPHAELLRACWQLRKDRYFRHSIQWALKTGTVPGWKVDQLTKALEQRAAREVEKARRVTSQWVGKPGERLEGTLTCKAVISGGGFQPWTLTLLVDQNGNSLATFGRCEVRKGESVRCKFTVKQHDERNGEKQTKILRIKKLA